MNRRLQSSLADLLALLLSLLLALVIWVNAQQGEDPTLRRALQIPVEFIGIPESVRIIEPSNLNSIVVVVFEGPTSVVDTLTAADFTATVDLSQIPRGEQQLAPITVRANTDEITLDAPAPGELAVHLEELITKEVPVELDLRGSLPRGYTADEPLVEPPSIIVKGIASDVERLAQARATVFLSNDDTQTKVVTPQPIFYDQQGRVAGVSNLELSQSTVTITVPIQEAADFANRVISVNLVGDPAPGYRVLNTSVNPASVLVTGRPSQLELPFRVQTEPIDVTGLTETFQTRVSLLLPSGITLDEVQEIIATVEIEPFSSTKIFNRPVQVLGLDEGLEAVVEPDSVRVVLFGPLPVLDALPEQEVAVTVDVFGLEQGIYELEPAVNIPERGVEKRSVQPTLVTVIINQPLTATTGLTETLLLEDDTAVTTPSPSLPRYHANAQKMGNSHSMIAILPESVCANPALKMGHGRTWTNTDKSLFSSRSSRASRLITTENLAACPLFRENSCL
jgi:YbbR domain-containing protein